MSYDAVLFVSFGGPDGPADVMPFLRNVVRGRNVPDERLQEVAEHYYSFGGRSPINQQNLALIDALRLELQREAVDLPIYWGNRNWKPYLADTIATMKDDGIKTAMAFVTSAFGSYSGCRQYRENIAAAQEEKAAGAMQIDKLPLFYNHPSFVRAMAGQVADARLQLADAAAANLLVVYTAHSIPTAMAETSRYVEQLEESCRLVSEAAGVPSYRLAYQSRSGPPAQPWLEPDVLSVLREAAESRSHSAVVLAPIGFVTDHIEVLYDLDTEARELCNILGLPMARAAAPGTHPAFVEMMCGLIREQMREETDRLREGGDRPAPDFCAPDCCAAPRHP